MATPKKTPSRSVAKKLDDTTITRHGKEAAAFMRKAEAASAKAEQYYTSAGQLILAVRAQLGKGTKAFGEWQRTHKLSPSQTSRAILQIEAPEKAKGQRDKAAKRKRAARAADKSLRPSANKPHRTEQAMAALDTLKPDERGNLIKSYSTKDVLITSTLTSMKTAFKQMAPQDQDEFADWMDRFIRERNKVGSK